MRVGAVGVLTTLAVASVVYAAIGDLEGGLVPYVLVVSFVLVHGALTPAQWRAAVRNRR